MKKLLSAVLALVMMFSLVTVGTTTAWADAPAEIPSGKVFAGYYKDSTYTDPSETATGYPKFVDENVLTAKYQLTANATEDMDSIKIRVVTTVDSRHYQAIGFHVWVDGVRKDTNGDEFRTTRVATSIKGTDGLDVFQYTPDYFSEDSKFFCAYNFTIAKAKYNTTLTFQPYWITMDGTEVTGNSGANGDGKRDIVINESPGFNNLLIGSASELYDFASNSKSRNYEGWKIKLTADIDLNPGFTATTDGFTDGNGGTPTQWPSIGSTSKYFKGNFDGQGHTISGMYQKTSDGATGTLYLGLFSATSGVSTVKNFRLENSYIYTRGARNGSIAGDGCGNFENIYSNAIIVTAGGNATAIGGMVGFFDGGTNVSYSGLHFDGTVTGSGYYVGGILGQAANSANTTLTIEDCRNSGTVSSSDVGVGSMVGLFDTASASTVVNITGCWNEGSVSATKGVQGFFVGRARGNGAPTVNISDSLNTFVTALNPMGSQVTGTTNVQRVLGARSSDIKIWPTEGDATSTSAANLKSFTAETTLSPYGFDFDTAWAAQYGSTPLPVAFDAHTLDKSWYVGEGPYVLNDIGDLNAFALLSQSDNFEGKTILLGADIDLNPGFTASVGGFTDGNSGTPTQWQSIGSTSKYFKGTFDGQGHTISGLYQNTNNATGNLYLGLFAATSGVSTIRNLRLENSYIYTKGARNGSIAGTGDGAFEDIYSNAIIVTAGNNATAIGGMVGFFDGGTNVSFSGLHFDGTVTGSGYYVGGILGQAANSANTTLTIANCRNSGTVFSSDVGAGSMVGLVDTASASTVVNITGCWNEGSASATGGVHGFFVGRSRGNGAPTVNITNCLNTFVTTLNPLGSQVTGTVNLQCILGARSSDVKIWSSTGSTTSVDPSELEASAAKAVLEPYGFDFSTAWGVRTGDVPAPKYFVEDELDLWSAEGSEEDPYVIYTEEDLRDFADKSQSDNFEGKFIKLGANINLNPGFTASVSGFTDGNGGTPRQWTSIGSTSKYFKGTFDGDGHTISGLYQNSSNHTGTLYLGLFAATSGASTVKNFRLTNSYIYTKGSRIGSIAGNGDGTFEDIYSNAIIVTAGGNATAIGGMIGYFDGSTNVSFSGLHYAGTLTGDGYYVGGILGQAANGAGTALTIENCRTSGAVSSSDVGVASIVGLVDTANASAAVNIASCWNDGTLAATSGVIGLFVGRSRGDGAAAVSISDCLNSTAYWLNPVGSDVTGTASVSCILCNRGSDVKIWSSSGSVTSVAPSALEGHTARGTLGAYGFDFTDAWGVRADDIPVPKYFAEEDMDIWAAEGTQADPYVLYIADDLREFAEKSQTDNFEGKYIKLGADIDLNPGFTATADGFSDGKGGTPVKWSSIGSTSKYFKGTFDGNGHTISGLYQATTVTFASATNVYLGLFAATSGVSTVKNFRLENSYIYSRGARVGSIAGNGDGNFENIYSDAIIVTEGGYATAIGGMIGYFDGSTNVSYSNLHFDGTLTGSGYYIGGILGQATSAASTTLTIADCRNSGSVTSSDTGAGGMVGLVETTAASTVVNIAGCWNSGTVSATNGAQGLFVGRTRGNGAPTVNITDSLNSFATTHNPVGSQVTGTVNHLRVLNVRSTDAKVWNASGVSTSNISHDSINGFALMAYDFDFLTAWAFRPGEYPVPAAFADMIPDTAWYDNGASPYVLSDAGDLYGFALLSKTNNFSGKTVKLGADIDLNDQGWTPIGSTSTPFAGTFDGQGHTISGVYLDTNAAYSGLFSDIASSGVVQNLRLEDSTLISSAQYLGSIAGRSQGTISNVYSDAAVENGQGRVGGLVGVASGTGSTLEKCWFDGTVTNTGSTGAAQGTGGLVGYVSNESSGSLTLRNCLFSGAIDSNAYTTHPAPVAGGLLGYVVKNTTVSIDGCLVTGSISYPGNVTNLVGPIAGIVEEGSLNNTLLLSRTYAVDSFPSLSGTHVVSGDNFNYDEPVADSFIYVSASSITGSAAQTAMPLLDWGTNWKYVAGKLPEIDFDHSAGAVSLAVGSADTAALSSLYSGRTLYQGELHEHADTSVGSDLGSSDGYTEVTDWYTQMPTLGLDFATSLDHQQTTHIDTDTWDKSKLIYGTEASTYVENVSNNDMNKYHYDMIFRTKAQLETVLTAFSGFKYGTYNSYPNWRNSAEGRTNSGKAQFAYPNFTHREDFASLIQAVQNAGGFFVLPHPFSTDEGNSSNIADYDFGVDGMGIQVIYAGHSTDNHLYSGWKQILARGTKVYACSGTDSHRDLENTCLTSIYGESAAATDKGYLIDQLRVGDFVAGSAGIKMCVGSTAMGGTCDFSGQRVVVDVDQLHVESNDLSHNYRLDVINDKGVVCSVKLTVNNDGSVGSGAELAFNADDSSAFYRVVVVDCNTRSRIAIGNPIWNS